MRTFVYTDEKSNKFWHIELSGKSFTVSFGRVGTAGQTQTKTFSGAAEAQKEHDKLVAEKLKKGYVETTPAAAAPPMSAVSSEQKALEAALVERADEVAAHSAYADYLMEQGDPRGEFVQVQLALEDPSRPKAERDKLRKREAALLKEHARQWLGDAGRFLVGDWSGEDKPYHYRFARGWLDSVRTLPIPEALVAALAKSPEARLLRRLEVVYDMQYHAFDFDQFTEGPKQAVRKGERSGEVYDARTTLPLLIESPYLANLRVLKFGFSDDDEEGPSHSTMVNPFDGSKGQHVIDLLEKCPRLEELYLNTPVTKTEELFGSPALRNLRVLQHYYGNNYSDYRSRHDPYPLVTLSKNKALARLTTLRFHPGRDTTIGLEDVDVIVRSKNLPALAHLQVHMTTDGDEIADRIVQSGVLKRLKTLDIGYGNMTDAGARTLAASPDLKHLEVLNVSRNALTQAGIRALRATGVNLVADDQHAADEQDYLYEVDRE